MSNTFTSLVRVGSDPELRSTPSGSQVLNFSAASTTGFGDKQQTLWLRVAYWRSPDKISQYIKKGGQLVVSGELSQREYQANDGTTRTSLELNANVIDLVGKRSDQAQASTNQQASTAQQQPAGTAPKTLDDFDDIPF